MPDGMKEKFDKDSSLPDIFGKYDDDMHSRFLVSFFKPITSCLIVLMLGIIWTFVRKIFVKKTQQNDLVKILIRKVELFLKWNIVVLLLICNIDEIALFSIIEYRTLNFDSFQGWASFSVSLFMVILGVIVIVAPFHLLCKIYHTRSKVLYNLSNENYFHLLKKAEGFKLLWIDFKDFSFPQRSFFSVYILRIAFIFTVIGLLYQSPLAQTIIFFILNASMTCYIIRAKPHRKTQDFLQTLSYEIFLLIISISILILAILDQTGSHAEQLRIFLGDVILFCNTPISLTALVFFGIRLWRGIEHVYKFSRTRTTKSLSKFIITLLKEDDLVNQELGRNEKTSTKLNLKGIEKKNLASSHMTPSSQETSSSLSGLIDLPQSSTNYTSRKHLKCLQPSLFSLERQKLDSETSAGSIVLKEKPASLCVDDSKLPVNVKIRRKIKERLERVKSKKMDYSEDLTMKDRVLETIRELDSIENTENQMKGVDPLQEEMSPLIVVNEGLGEIKEKKEEAEKLKRKNDLFKKNRAGRQDAIVEEDTLFN